MVDLRLNVVQLLFYKLCKELLPVLLDTQEISALNKRAELVGYKNMVLPLVKISITQYLQWLANGIY